jgi:ubiquinol-cytochrome c reductase cytochrome c1 subunit
MTSTLICRTSRQNPQILFDVIRNSSSSSTSSQSTIRWKRLAYQITGGLLTAGALGYTWAYSQAVHASGNKAHLVSLPWSFRGPFDSLDHASVRRGFEVYKQVCAACHSLKFLAYRHLVGVTHTEEEVKAIAAQDQINDGPDDQGNMFQRPGKLTDYMPAPYPNDKAAKAGNGGALPPDLSLITLGRDDGCNYLFNLLTGYQDQPAGVKGEPGLHYNPYFSGGWIAMAKQLYDDQIEYTDGTKASESQLAKDVTEFLKWTAERDHDDRKKLAIKAILIFAPLVVLSYHWKRVKWATLKSRKIAFYRPKPKED